MRRAAQRVAPRFSQTAVSATRAFAATQLLFPSGKVASWNDNRGFGFVHQDNAEKTSAFVHRTQVKVEEGGVAGLSVGQEVEYDLVTKDGKAAAENVTGPDGIPLPSFAGGRGGGGGDGQGGGASSRRPKGDDNGQSSEKRSSPRRQPQKTPAELENPDYVWVQQRDANGKRIGVAFKVTGLATTDARANDVDGLKTGIKARKPVGCRHVDADEISVYNGKGDDRLPPNAHLEWAACRRPYTFTVPEPTQL